MRVSVWFDTDASLGLWFYADASLGLNCFILMPDKAHSFKQIHVYAYMVNLMQH